MGKKDNGNTRTFTCETCKVELANTGEFTEHMKTAHGLESDGLKGTRRMISHMDAQDWHSSVYQWDFDGIVVTEATCCKRDPESQMYWGG